MEVILDSGADLSCLPMSLGDHDFGPPKHAVLLVFYT